MTKAKAILALLRPGGEWSQVPGGVLLVLASLAVHMLAMGFSGSGETHPPGLVLQTLTLEIAEIEAEEVRPVPPNPVVSPEEVPPLPPLEEPELLLPESEVAVPALPDLPDLPELPELPDLPPLPDLPLPAPPVAPELPPPAEASQGNTGRVNLPIASDHVVKPRYPDSARRERREGKVRLRIEVLASGRVGEVAVSLSSGHADLDRAAIDALRRSRFRPAMRNGAAVDGVLEQEVVFNLEEAK